MSKFRSYTSAERKEAPLWSVMAQYFPDAFMALARLSKKANDKHNPGGPMHWAREKSKDHLECAARHLLTPDEIDPETGEIELAAALWRCAAALQLREEARLTAAGIKPLSGVVPAETPKADDEGWTEWKGGVCPVPGDTLIQIKLRNGITNTNTNRAGIWRWNHLDNVNDIIAYRAVK